MVESSNKASSDSSTSSSTEEILDEDLLEIVLEKNHYLPGEVFSGVVKEN